MGKVTNFAKKIWNGSPEYQERKRQEKEAQREARTQEMLGYKAGLAAGARERGFERGKQKGQGGSGFLAGAGRTMKAFNEGAKAMGFSDFGMDIGNIGGGTGGNISDLGMGASNLLNMGGNNPFGGGSGPRGPRRKTKVRVVHHYHNHRKKGGRR